MREVHQMIKTERLSIRRVCADDWKAIQSIWKDAAGSPYAQFDRPNRLDDCSVSLRIKKWASFADSDEHIFWAICLYDSVIGYTAFHKRGDSYEIGYCFHSDYHGNGYARESISSLIDRMRAKGISRIVAGTALKNTPSVNLLLALGFEQCGTEEVSFYRDKEGNAIVFEGGIFELSFRER